MKFYRQKSIRQLRPILSFFSNLTLDAIEEAKKLVKKSKMKRYSSARMKRGKQCLPFLFQQPNLL